MREKVPLSLGHFLLLLLLFAASLLLNTLGLRAELPSEEALELTLPDTRLRVPVLKEMARLQDRLRTMEETRDYSARPGEVTKKVEGQSDYYSFLESEIPIKLEGGTVFASRTKLKWIADNLTNSQFPDEPLVISALASMKPERWDFNPHLFLYGGMYLYPMAAALKVGSMAGLVQLTPDRSFYLSHPWEMGKIYLIGKITGAVAGALAVIVIFFVGKSFYGPRVGLLSAAFFALCPAVVVEAHYLKPHLYSTLWILLSLWAAAKLIQSERWSWYVLGGLFAGFAAGSLLTSGYVLLSFPVLWLLNWRRGRGPSQRRLLLACIIAFSGAYLLTNPYVLSSTKDLAADFARGRTGHLNAHWLELSTLPHLFTVFRSFSLPFALAVAGGLWLACRERKRGDVALLSCIAFFTLAGIFFFFQTKDNLAHYYSPLLPILVLPGARFMDWLVFERLRRDRWLAYSLLTLTILASASSSLFYGLTFAVEHPRISAGRWINANIPPGSSIGNRVPDNLLMTGRGYPPYDYLSYNFLNDPFPWLKFTRERMPQYLVSAVKMGYREDEDPLLSRAVSDVIRRYGLVKKFSSEVPLLGRIHSNKLTNFWVEEVRVYQR